VLEQRELLMGVEGEGEGGSLAPAQPGFLLGHALHGRLLPLQPEAGLLPDRPQVPHGLGHHGRACHHHLNLPWGHGDGEGRGDMATTT